MRDAILYRVEKKQSWLLPSGYPSCGLIKIQPAWGTHGLYWENNEVGTKKLLGGKLCNLVLSEIYISRIREQADIPLQTATHFQIILIPVLQST